MKYDGAKITTCTLVGLNIAFHMYLPSERGVKHKSKHLD